MDVLLLVGFAWSRTMKVPDRTLLRVSCRYSCSGLASLMVLLLMEPRTRGQSAHGQTSECWHAFSDLLEVLCSANFLLDLAAWCQSDSLVQQQLVAGHVVCLWLSVELLETSLSISVFNLWASNMEAAREGCAWMLPVMGQLRSRRKVQGGQLSGNAEACNRTWPKKCSTHETWTGKERITNHSRDKSTCHQNHRYHRPEKYYWTK
eukprot:1150175-Pelagomonas_calceolata.AAC.3